METTDNTIRDGLAELDGRYMVLKNDCEMESTDDIYTALQAINDFEARDIYDDSYEPGRYTIYDNTKQETVWP